MSEGDQTFLGGAGQDFYVIGENFGNDIISDVVGPLEPGRAADTVWFSHLSSEDAILTRDGIDLIIEDSNTGDTVRIRDQFDGELPGLFGGDLSQDSEIVSIFFADGVSFEEVDIAFAVSRPTDADDLILGTGDLDVLDLSLIHI